ncbi:MAG: hypothetical protein DRH56_08205, partial [Deltaproteobacteria bacterium]
AKTGRFESVSEGGETFEKCSILAKFKKGENFNRRNTLKYFEDLSALGGLKFETDAEIGQKGAFCKGLEG